jgi:hypothetical protein
MPELEGTSGEYWLADAEVKVAKLLQPEGQAQKSRK